MPPAPIESNTQSQREDGLTGEQRASIGLAAGSASDASKNFARGRPQSNRSLTASTVSRKSIQSIRSSQLATHEDSSVPEASLHQSTAWPLSSASSTSPPTSGSASSSPRRNEPSGSDSSGAGTAGVEDSTDSATPAEPSTDSPPDRPPNRRPRARKLKSARQDASRSRAQTQTPMKLSDLGQDYSRYPLPSRNNSFSKLPISGPIHSNRGRPGAEPSTLPLSLSQSSSADSVTDISYIVDPEKGASWLLDDRIGAPFISEAGKIPLYTDEKEVDDDLHNPLPDDDLRYKPKLRDCFALRHCGSMLGLIFLVVGLFSLFILLPVLSFTGHAAFSYPNDPPVTNDNSFVDPAKKVNDVKYPLMKNIRVGLIDPGTPKSAMKRTTFDGEQLELVFSDEFKTPNRTFYPGDDPFWTAPDIWYGSTQDLEWYDPDAVTTGGDTLKLTIEQFVNHELNYRSGMLNSWNQICFKGGALEVSVSLPGPGGASGLWPGVWAMGNLGRPGYKASTEGLWPYTYNSCDAGITPNQSMTDGTSYLFGQKLPSCTCAGEDHPTPGTGRGAPEIDVFEGSADPQAHLGVITQSYQVAPFDIWYHPNYDYFEIPNYNVTQMNSYCGGPYQQAVSGQTLLNNQWYDGNKYQKYGFEYEPGTGSQGKITWFVGDEKSFKITGDAVGPNGNVDSRPISQEPMSIILNLGFSVSWTGINMAELRFPTTMYVDYVRWYQKPGEHSVTCDPPGYETTQYIKDHLVAYENYNLTKWDQTGFAWPKHKMNTDC